MHSLRPSPFTLFTQSRIEGRVVLICRGRTFDILCIANFHFCISCGNRLPRREPIPVLRSVPIPKSIPFPVERAISMLLMIFLPVSRTPFRNRVANSLPIWMTCRVSSSSSSTNSPRISDKTAAACSTSGLRGSRFKSATVFTEGDPLLTPVLGIWWTSAWRPIGGKVGGSITGGDREETVVVKHDKTTASRLTGSKTTLPIIQYGG